MVIGLSSVSYVIGSILAGTNFGEFMRGSMIGVNAGLNVMLVTAIVSPVVGVALGAINFLAAFWLLLMQSPMMIHIRAFSVGRVVLCLCLGSRLVLV